MEHQVLLYDAVGVHDRDRQHARLGCEQPHQPSDEGAVPDVAEPAVGALLGYFEGRAPGVGVIHPTGVAPGRVVPSTVAEPGMLADLGVEHRDDRPPARLGLGCRPRGWLHADEEEAGTQGAVTLLCGQTAELADRIGFIGDEYPIQRERCRQAVGAQGVAHGPRIEPGRAGQLKEPALPVRMGLEPQLLVAGPRPLQDQLDLGQRVVDPVRIGPQDGPLVAER